MKSEQPSLYYFVEDPLDPFVYNEISSLHKMGISVEVFTLNENTHITNWELGVLHQNWNARRLSFFQLLSKYLGIMLHILFSELRTKPRHTITHFPLVLSTLRKNLNIYENMKAVIELGKSNSIFYSFWFYDTTFLSIAKYKKEIHKYFSRTHRGDLYEEENSGLWLPFRKFNLGQVSKLYTISQHGEEYLKRKHGNSIHVETCYLGTAGLKGTPLNQESDQIFLISVAQITDKKRVHLIPQMLQFVQLDKPIIWKHYGPLLEETEVKKIRKEIEAIENKNISCELCGEVSNEKLMEVFSENYIDAFISMSYTEGLPVSMMEACSAGVPILATDAGGCKEIVNEITGKLLPLDIEPKTAAQELMTLLEQNKIVERRLKIIEFWEQNFSAEKNYAKLYTSMKSHLKTCN